MEQMSKKFNEITGGAYGEAGQVTESNKAA
jgi:hypothetical protein